MINPFSHESLWNKAKLFMERGLVARSESKEEEWPLWASLAAELLGKAVLAKRHPVLVAHPGTADGTADSLLFAAGIGGKKEGLQSIQMSTVISRLVKVLPPTFDGKVQAALRNVSHLRNEELHSGATPFVNYGEHLWAPGFWGAIALLLADIDKSVRDFVGKDLEPMVKEWILASENKTNEEVARLSGEAKAKWKVRSEDNGGEKAYRQKISSEVEAEAHEGLRALCPVCQCTGKLEHFGTVLSSVRRAGDYRITVDKRFRAELFTCKGCGLRLDGTALLVKAGLPADIAEECEPEDEGDEYGND